MLLAKVIDFSESLCSTYEKTIAIKEAMGSAMIKPAILGYWPANQLEKAIMISDEIYPQTIWVGRNRYFSIPIKSRRA